jgi:phage-related protein
LDIPYKPLYWIGSALEIIRVFPVDVKKTIGFALATAQHGGKHIDAKPLKGFGGAGVLEIVEDNRGNTYRAVYAVKFAKVIYVLHAFQKKSKQGIKTPREHLTLIRERLEIARVDYESKLAKGFFHEKK